MQFAPVMFDDEIGQLAKPADAKTRTDYAVQVMDERTDQLAYECRGFSMMQVAEFLCKLNSDDRTAHLFGEVYLPVGEELEPVGDWFYCAAVD